MKEQSATPNSGADRRHKYRHTAPSPDVHAITNAAVAHSDEMRQRMIKYAITMGIRMVCLVLIFAFDGWYRLVPVVGAVVLPWVAVMIANGGADISHQETVELLDDAPLYAVGAGNPDGVDAEASKADLLTGEIIPDEEASPETAAQTKPSSEREPASDTEPGSKTGTVPEDKHHEHL